MRPWVWAVLVSPGGRRRECIDGGVDCSISLRRMRVGRSVAGEEGLLEGSGVGDLGDGGAAGLLGGFEGDAAPAVDTFGGGLGEVFFGAAGEDGGDAGDAEFGGFFDAPLEMVELEDGDEEMEGEGGVGLELFVEGEVDGLRSDGGDRGAVEEAVGDDVIDLAGLGAEDAAEVGGLIAGEGGSGGRPGVGDEAAAGHGRVVRCALARGGRQGWGGVLGIPTTSEGWW